MKQKHSANIAQHITTNIIGQVFVKATSIASAILLTRIIGATEMGVLALATQPISGASLLIDGGVTTAIIQRKQISKGQAAGALIALVSLATSVAIALMLFSSTYAKWTNEPITSHIIIASSLLLIANAYVIWITALYRRCNKWRAIWQVQAAATIIGTFATSLVLAICNFGLWSIIYGQAASVLISIIGLHRSPRLNPRQVAFDRSISYEATGNLVVNLLNWAFTSIEVFLISQLFGLEATGHYTRLAVIASLVPLISTVPIQMVLASNTNKWGNTAPTGAMLLTALLLSMPCCLFIIANASVLPTLVFGSSWNELGDILIPLAVGIIPSTAFGILGTHLAAHKKFHAVYTGQVAGIAAIVTSVTILTPRTTEQFAWCIVAASLIRCAVIMIASQSIIAHIPRTIVGLPRQHKLLLLAWIAAAATIFIFHKSPHTHYSNFIIVILSAASLSIVPKLRITNK